MKLALLLDAGEFMLMHMTIILILFQITGQSSCLQVNVNDM